MSFTPKAIVLYLKAASGAIPLDRPGIYLVSEEGGDLSERHWIGAELRDQSFITSDVRENTPALYILTGDERRVFCADKNNCLRCYQYDEEEEGWEEDSLRSNQEVVIPPSSRLSGCRTGSSQFVFFQGQFGELLGVQVQLDGGWGRTPKIPICRHEETPHSVIASDDGLLHMLYVHQDNHIHHTVINPETWRHHDTVLPGTSLESDQITNFIAIADNDMNFEICALSSTEKLIRIDKDGVKTELGRITQGQFVATSSQECVIMMLGLIRKAIKAVTGTKHKRV